MPSLYHQIQLLILVLKCLAGMLLGLTLGMHKVLWDLLRLVRSVAQKLMY